MKVINDNMDNSDLSVDMIAREVGHQPCASAPPE